MISKRPEKGAYFKENIVYKSSMSVKKFRELALSPEYSNPKPETTLQELERYFWRNIVCHQPLYGAGRLKWNPISSTTIENYKPIITIERLLSTTNEHNTLDNIQLTSICFCDLLVIAFGSFIVKCIDRMASHSSECSPCLVLVWSK